MVGTLCILVQISLFVRNYNYFFIKCKKNASFVISASLIMEGAQVLEVRCYNSEFYNSEACYVLGSLLNICTWLRPCSLAL